MKTLLYLLSCVILSATLSCPPVLASEITGNISTDPSATFVITDIPNGTGGTPSTTTPQNAEETQSSDPTWMFLPKASAIADKKVVSKPGEERVLGEKEYADGSLLRDGRGRIYLVRGGSRRHIISLGQLKRYAGRPIYSVSDVLLGRYQDKNYLDGELIREIGDHKIYVMTQGAKKHILSLEELRAKYLGQEIINISKEEMSLVP